MKPKSLEIFIPGPAGRLEAKYYKNPKFGSPVAIVLHPHPQYGFYAEVEAADQK